MSPEAVAFVAALRGVNAEIADLLERELRRGVPLATVKTELARLMIETHPDVVAKHMTGVGN